ncbi:MAG TPA: hypothetical protein PLH34_10305 [Bacillota bacterium]|nr:hypothetical protein [Bacillota bacterium]
MLIETLIRLGRPLVQGGLPPGEIIRQITDVAEPTAKNFLARVYVIEISRRNGVFQSACLPAQEWGQYQQVGKSSKKVFEPDLDRAVGAPFVLPKGGNPLMPQGRYGLPVYPIYDRTVRAIRGADSEEAVELCMSFLSPRIERTPGFSLSELEIAKVASDLSLAVQSARIDEAANALGLVVLAETTEDGPFGLEDSVPSGNPRLAYIGSSVLEKGRHIVSRLDRCIQPFWEAKIEEGVEGGEKVGPDASCFFCDNSGRTISAYCKAWPWMTPTWEFPFPSSWLSTRSRTTGIDQMVHGIALCEECYKALSYGASVFLKLSTPMDTWLTRELFSPVTSARGKETSKAGGSVERIYGTAIALPILDTFLEDPDCEEFAEAISYMLSQSNGSGADVHLSSIAGLETFIPEQLSKDDFRISIIYFSGNVSRGDIHLRATIEDVMPSTARSLTKLVREIAEASLNVAMAVRAREISDKEAAFLKSRYSSLPYLLTVAYGGPYLWDTLSSALHRANLSYERFVSNSSIRMGQLARQLPDSRDILQGEVIFYLTFREFLRLYRQEIMVSEKGGAESAMRDWRTLLDMMAKEPPTDMCFENVEELGFGCGYLTGVFSRQYWVASKSGDKGKDYLKHRVMTFGTDLTPDVLYRRGLGRMEEVSRRVDMHLSEDFRIRLGIVLAEYSRMEDQVMSNRHGFMAAFWSGYNLSSVAAREQRAASDALA